MNTITSNTLSVHSHSSSVAINKSFPDGCLRITVSAKEFIPWDNPDNIVGVEVEAFIQKIKTFMIAFLFFIGGPANVINMAVFYKQGLKDRVNLCLFAQAMADEMYLIALTIPNTEQLYLQFTTKETFGPVFSFYLNNNFTAFRGFSFVSFILMAIIASERCLCVFSPLKFQTLLRTRTMAAIILVVYIVVLALYFIASFRHRVVCAYNPVSGAVFNTPITGEVYKTHRQFIDHVESLVFGAGLPGLTITVVIVTTIVTTVKLRQIVTWRAGTSSSISPRELALTKMLIGSSILFIVCVLPIAVIRISNLFMPEMNSGGRHHNFFLATVWIRELVSFINSTFNFVVYFVMGSRYRETFWVLFGRKQKPEKA